jgi:predicted permease
MFQDLRYGARMLLKNKGFTFVAVLSLTLAIGANTLLFSLIDAVLLKPLPVTRPQDLVLFKWSSGPKVMARNIKGPPVYDQEGLRTGNTFSYLAFQRLRAQSTSLTTVFAFYPVEQLNVKVGGEAEIANGQLVSGNYYRDLGVQTITGRAFNDSDDLPGAASVVVISYRYWRRRFGLSEAALGKTISINKNPFTIIGVTPPEFHGALQIGSDPDFSLPLQQESRMNGEGSPVSVMNEPWSWSLHIMGRLRPNVTPEAARANLERIYQQSAIDGWSASGEIGQQDLPRLRIVPGDQGLTEQRSAYSRPLQILMAVVGLTLLIACVNLANLQLARSAARQTELASRLALGASRFRLVRQLLTESVLLAVCGGLGGLALAFYGRDLLRPLQPWGGDEFSLDLHLDFRVLAFTAALSLFSSILFGLEPALRATRIDLTSALKDNSRTSSGRVTPHLNRVFIGVQVALSLVLLLGAGLFLRTLRNLETVEVGFNPENLLVFRVDPRLNGYQSEQINSLYKRMTDHIAALPGVSAVTYSRFALLGGDWADSPFNVLGRPSLPDQEKSVHVMRVGPDYFKTLENPLLRGRSITDRDGSQAPRVAVVNQALAQKFFPNEDPIGQRFFFGGLVAPDATPDPSRVIEIVGVVSDMKYRSLRQIIPPTVYTPAAQTPGGQGQMAFAVRITNDPLAMVPAIRAAVREIDGNLPLFEFSTQAHLAEQSVRDERLFAWLTSFFGLLALTLVSIGLYGVTAYSVTSRTHELGIRLALGASGTDILKMVIKKGMAPVFIGAGIGVMGALALTRLIASLLFGVKPTDALTFTTVSVLLIVVALLACYLPARRATKVDPLVALRYE